MGDNRRFRTTQEFIKQFRDVHGDKFDYSEFVYVNIKTRGKVKCNTCSYVFYPFPTSHSGGSGCLQCARKSISLSKLEFINRATEKHGIEYDYSEIVYYKLTAIVKSIRCRVHGLFDKNGNQHINGGGCILCHPKGGSNPLTLDQFKNKADKKHSNKYDYSLILQYFGGNHIYEIICPNHNVFKLTGEAHLGGAYCPACIIEKRKANPRVSTRRRSQDQFEKEAREIHGDRYNYDDTIYVNKRQKITISCSIHGSWETIGQHHLKGGGCPKCAHDNHSKMMKMTNEEFLDRAFEIHGDTYDYDLVVYNGVHHCIDILCRKHGVFSQTPSNHFSGSGCSQCNNGYQVSSLSTEWLDGLNVPIKEWRIPGTRKKADGFCPITNTVYEFHGSYWHGDPRVFNSNEMSSQFGITYGDLYRRTLERENMIISKGYNLIVKWEFDYRAEKKAEKALLPKQKRRKRFIQPAP